MISEQSGKKDSKTDEFIFRYRWYIGSVLLLCIMLSGGYLYWRTSENNELRIMNNGGAEQLSKKIDEQNVKIAELENKINGIATIATTNEVSAPTTDSGDVAGVATKTTANSSPLSAKINLNTASASQLDTLPGIGPAYASRIIEYRNNNGGFKDISEVQNIKGIGSKTFEKIKDLITI
ncbi:MAG: ComE operon protein 1 [bacterium ADurb.Bin212]|nr:MAG: ComE operon protein 1 [bacterium ADurb.Bin212]